MRIKILKDPKQRPERVVLELLPGEAKELYEQIGDLVRPGQKVLQLYSELEAVFENMATLEQSQARDIKYLKRVK